MAKLSKSDKRKIKLHFLSSKQAYKDAVEWAWSAIVNTLLWTKKAVDGADEYLGAKIWERKNKITNTMRRYILRTLIGAGVLWGTVYVWNTIYDTLDHRKEITNSEKDSLPEEVNKLLLWCKLKNFKEWTTCRWIQEKREKRYRGQDTNRDIYQKWEKKWQSINRHTERMKEGFERMVNEWHLEMILEKCDEYWVPYDVVFLAIAESYWKAWADSWVAWGYRQFTKNSGKLFGVIKNWIDYRNDPKISTEAAMKHLVANYNIVTNWEKKKNFEMSEDDKWKFAMRMYNGSPKLIKQWMFPAEWNANLYAQYQNNTESKNYVPRILAIKNILSEFSQDWEKWNMYYAFSETKKTETDLLYELYIEEKSDKTVEENKKALEKIKKEYEKEYKDNKISNDYLYCVLSVIDEELTSLEWDSDVLKSEIKEEQEPWIFTFENYSKDKKYKVYSYIIVVWGNPWGVINQFQKQSENKDVNKLLIVDIDGNEYSKDKTFSKWEKVYLKERIKAEYWDFIYKRNNGKWEDVFEYTVKKWDNATAISRSFNTMIEQSGKKYKKTTYKNIVSADRNQKTELTIGEKIYIVVKK